MTTALAVALQNVPIERGRNPESMMDGQTFVIALTEADAQCAATPRQLVQSVAPRCAPPSDAMFGNVGFIGISAPVDVGPPSELDHYGAVISGQLDLASGQIVTEEDQDDAVVGSSKEELKPALLAASDARTNPAFLYSSFNARKTISGEAHLSNKLPVEASLASEDQIPTTELQFGGSSLLVVEVISAKAALAGAKQRLGGEPEAEEPLSLTLPSPAATTVQTIHSITQANKDFQIDASFVDTDSSISEIRSTVTVDSAYSADFAGTESGPVSEYETPVNRPNLPNLTSEKAQPGILDTQTSRYLQLDARPAAVPSTVEAVIAARNGVGRSLGLEIARTMADGKHQIFVRLDPKELGQLDVRLSFDSSGELRAVVTTTTASSADLIRQDMPSLLRSLSDAGVRVDDRSIRLDLQSGAQSGSGQGHSHKNDQRSRQYPANKEQQQDEDLTYITRRWRAGSQVELRA